MNQGIAEMFSLHGKTALISGASSGLGAYFAEVLADAGAEVILAARRADKLESLAATIVDRGGRAHALAMDVTDGASVEAAFATLDGMVERLDILVNNAGISTRPQKFVEQEESVWSGLLNVNLQGAWRVARQAAMRMREQKSGCIINTGSIYSLCTGIMKADYNVSKVAVAQLTRNMGLELGRHGVRVNTLCPGYFASDINAAEFATERGQEYIRRLVPQRLGEYRELAGPLLLLASDAGSFVNGIELPVDGGTLLSPI